MYSQFYTFEILEKRLSKQYISCLNKIILLTATNKKYFISLISFKEKVPKNF